MNGGKLAEFYVNNYKKFLYIPFLLLAVAFVLIFMHLGATGDVINRDISLKGGVTMTILHPGEVDMASLRAALRAELAPNEVSIRELKATGETIGVLIESDLQDLSQERLDRLLMLVQEQIGTELKEGEYSIETMGSALGSSFFIQTMRAMILAFLFMGVVVFLYFRSFIPSGAVILSALSDIVVTVAFLNLIDFKMGTAGIAALLMLIGYSIDTDIMLTTRVLKRGDTSLVDAIKGAFTTGMTMTLTTIVAVTVALVFTDSEVIRQIMMVLLVGLVIDIINTWIQNVGLLIWYDRRKRG